MQRRQIDPETAQPQLSALPPNPVSRQLLSLAEAADALGVCPRFLSKLEARGQLRFTRLGRRVLVPATEVERLATEGAR